MMTCRPKLKTECPRHQPGESQCLTGHMMNMGWYVWQHGQVSRSFDSYSQSPLMPGANTGLTPRRNLPSVGNKLLQL